MGKSSLRCIVKDVHYMRLKYLFLFSLHFNYPFFFLSLSLFMFLLIPSLGDLVQPSILFPLSLLLFGLPQICFSFPFCLFFPKDFPFLFVSLNLSS